MYNASKKEPWYGELRTKQGNIIVIRDNQLPEATAGRIYLYNTEREAIIEYVESIVTSKLHDLNEKDQKEAEKKYGAQWQIARDAMIQKHKNRFKVTKIAVKEDSHKNIGLAAFDDADIDDDYELDEVFDDDQSQAM